MKKNLLLFVLTLVSAYTVILSDSHNNNVYAARNDGTLGTPESCSNEGDPNDPDAKNPDDTNFFPFRFLCGTAPDNLTRISGGYGYFRAVNLNSIFTPVNGNTIDNPSISPKIHDGDVIRVSGKFTDSESPKQYNRATRNIEPADAILWVTIDTSAGAYTSGLSALTPGMGQRDCPGGNNVNNGPGPVFGYRDLRDNFHKDANTYPNARDPGGPYTLPGTPSRVNGINASPLAYNPDTGRGKIDCKQQGKMVYWRKAQSATDYTFDLKLPKNVGDKDVCLRMNISVEFTSDNGLLFPPPANNDDPYQQERSLSHLVKQSNSICFDVIKVPPRGGGGSSASWKYDGDITATCSSLDISMTRYNKNTGAIDSSGTEVLYQIQRKNPGTGVWEEYLPPGYTRPQIKIASGSTSNYPLDGRAFIGNHVGNQFRLKIVDDSDPYIPGPGSAEPGKIVGEELDCLDDPPAGGRDAVCTGNITGFAYDPDTIGSTYVQINYTNGDRDKDGVLIQHELTSTPLLAEANLPPWAPPGTPSDHGFSIEVPDYLRDGQDHVIYVYMQDFKLGQSNSPVVWDSDPISILMAGCSKFELTPTIDYAALRDSPENPTWFQAISKIYAFLPDWKIGVPKPTIKGAFSSNSITLNGIIRGGPYPGNTEFATTGSTNQTYELKPLPSVIVGDDYCAIVKVSAGKGFVDSGGNIIPGTTNGEGSDTSCDVIANRPFFKVYGSGISAGGDFEGTACTGGGLLGGWLNSQYEGVYTYGANSELSALALIQITGVASAQTSSSRSASALSFANDDPSKITQASIPPAPASFYSPKMGGNFGATSSHCMHTMNTPVDATDHTAATMDISTLGLGKKSFKHSGNLQIIGGLNAIKSGGPAGNASDTTKLSIYVDGDVYIGSDISLDGPQDWNAGIGNKAKNTVPSFKIRATGNIYIGEDVRQLTGVYVAQPKPDGTKGTIYTCSDTVSHFTFMAASNLFSKCNQQLTVTGTFIAKKLNLMRTYGTLRNEAPVPGTTPTTDLLYKEDGSHPAGYHCEDLPEPNDPEWQSKIPSICVPNGSTLTLRWTNSGSTPDDHPFCTRFTDQTAPVDPFGGAQATDSTLDDSHTWNNDFLCSNEDVNIEFLSRIIDPSTPTRKCVMLTHTSDLDNNRHTRSRLCISKTAGVAAPSSLLCDNNPPAGKSTLRFTCASEVFDFSPELYLTEGNDVGSFKFDAITSLPPVL